MDYPASVPGVGLVGGKFVDEDPVLGTQGSLIPAAWGNSLTDELLAVIKGAGLVPAEGVHDQLLRAIRGASGSLSGNANLAVSRAGLLLLDASGGARTFSLPAAASASNAPEFLLWRVDATANALVIAASGEDKIMLDTAAQAAGQSTTELLFAGDFMRLRSDGSGKWLCVGQAQLPASIASGLVVPAVGVSTFTVPAVMRSGRVRPRVTVTGGGGGAGGGTTAGTDTPPRGAGGGGGGTAIGVIDLAGVSSVVVTVGPGGGGGSAGSIGIPGGASSFGAYLTGTGGAAGAGATPTNTSAGGSGGAGTGGALNVAGGQGSDGPVQNGKGLGGSGDGGGSFWGGGSRSAGSGTPTGAAARGGGGGGSDGVGGSGAAGVVLIEW